MEVEELAFLGAEDLISLATGVVSTPLLVGLQIPLAVRHHVHGMRKPIVLGEYINIRTAALGFQKLAEAQP